MAFAFDTLGYSKRLRDAGVAQDHAEAHAEAAREFIMTELVTKSDLLAVKTELQHSINAVRTDMDHLALRLTVRLGGLMVAGIGALALLQRMH